MAFVASLLVVKPFLQLRPAIGLRAVRLVSHRRSALVLLAAIAAGWM